MDIQLVDNKISKYQTDITEHASWIKYNVRINKEFIIDIIDLRKKYGGDLFEEDAKIIHRIFEKFLSKDRILVSLFRIGDKETLIFRKSDISEKEENCQPIISKNIKKIKYKVPLKPWKDPESLFCDTKFLREFLGKEPRKCNQKIKSKEK